MHQLYVKHTDDQKLAHLYEHIVFDYVCRELMDHGFIHVIDYDITPQTAFSGLVTMSMWGANKEVNKIISNALQSSANTINRSNIERCASQIACEKLSDVTYDLQDVKEGLRRYAAQRWLSVESKEVIDIGRRGAAARDTDSPHFSYTKAPHHFDRVRVDYTVKDHVYRDAPARLYVIAQLVDSIQNELRTALVREGVAAYWSRTTFRRSKRQVRISQHLVFPKPANEQGYTRALNSLERLWDMGIIKRLAHSLQQFGTKPDAAIEANSDLYYNLGVFVGIESLKVELSPETLDEISDAITVNSWIAPS
jgi:hypothetical protein